MGPQFLKGNFGDFYGSSMLPALELVFRHELPMHSGTLDPLFRSKSTSIDIYQMSSTHDVSLFNAMTEGQDYSFVSTKQGANKTLSVVKYGLGVSISEEAVADGKFDELADLLRKLAKSAQESRTIQLANMFNNGFSSETTPDGVAWLSASHTFPSGGTMSNILATASDLSETSLQIARYSFSTAFIGDSGIIYKMIPKVLLVHPSNEAYAEELVGSEGKPDSADNNLNSLKRHGIQVISSPHLTDQDAWFLLASPAEAGLLRVEREGIVTKAGGPDVGFINDSIFYKSRYRWVLGVEHPYGVIATPGV